jgi:hypothetical protein
VREKATRAEIQQRRCAGRRQQWLAGAMTAAVLVSGLNALVQVGRVALEYGCQHGWLAAECRPRADRR